MNLMDMDDDNDTLKIITNTLNNEKQITRKIYIMTVYITKSDTLN
jgi:hypothetical protein